MLELDRVLVAGPPPPRTDPRTLLHHDPSRSSGRKWPHCFSPSTSMPASRSAAPGLLRNGFATCFSRCAAGNGNLHRFHHRENIDITTIAGNYVNVFSMGRGKADVLFSGAVRLRPRSTYLRSSVPNSFADGAGHRIVIQ